METHHSCPLQRLPSTSSPIRDVHCHGWLPNGTEVYPTQPQTWVKGTLMGKHVWFMEQNLLSVAFPSWNNPATNRISKIQMVVNHLPLNRYEHKRTNATIQPVRTPLWSTINLITYYKSRISHPVVAFPSHQIHRRESPLGRPGASTQPSVQPKEILTLRQIRSSQGPPGEWWSFRLFRLCLKKRVTQGRICFEYVKDTLRRYVQYVV
jgi:hypothetical protein